MKSDFTAGGVILLLGLVPGILIFLVEFERYLKYRGDLRAGIADVFSGEVRDVFTDLDTTTFVVGGRTFSTAGVDTTVDGECVEIHVAPKSGLSLAFIKLDRDEHDEGNFPRQ